MAGARRLACVAALATVVIGASTAPASAAVRDLGALSSADQQVTWKGQYFKNAFVPSPALCPLLGCEELHLRVALPPGTWSAPGGLQIGIRWPEDEENSQDLDLYVYGPDGKLAGKSDGFFGSSAESVLVPRAGNGTYRIVVVPRYADTDGMAYEGLAEVEHALPSQPVRTLLPDLVALPPRQLHFATAQYLLDLGLPTNGLSSCYPEERIEQHARRCLRFDQVLANLGDGPFELQYRLSGILTDKQLRQRIYRSDGTHFDRVADTYEFHPAHAHFHYKNFAQSRLWASDASGAKRGAAPVRVGKKNGFCMIDVSNVMWGQKGDGARTYYFPRCNVPEDSDAQGVYMRNGISVGWADVYNWYLADQFIEVSGVPDGFYVLETQVDPVNTIVETNEHDNVSAVLIRLHGDSAEIVRELAAGRAAPGASHRARLRLSVRPRRAHVGRRTRFRFRATYLSAGRRVAARGVRIRFAGKRVRTDRRGRAAIKATFRRRGRFLARAGRTGLLPGRASVRVVR